MGDKPVPCVAHDQQAEALFEGDASVLFTAEVAERAEELWIGLSPGGTCGDPDAIGTVVSSWRRHHRGVRLRAPGAGGVSPRPPCSFAKCGVIPLLPRSGEQGPGDLLLSRYRRQYSILVFFCQAGVCFPAREGQTPHGRAERCPTRGSSDASGCVSGHAQAVPAGTVDCKSAVPVMYLRWGAMATAGASPPPFAKASPFAKAPPSAQAISTPGARL